MPVYDQAWIAHRAAQSLAWQTFRDFEVIVVDDGSTDGLDAAKVARAAGTESHAWTRQLEPGGSAAKAINAGIELARGEYLTWVSGDNIMEPDWLATLVAEIEKGAGAAFGGFLFVPARRAQVEAIVADTRLSLAAVVAHWRQAFPCRRLFRAQDGKQVEREDCGYGPAFLMRRETWTPHEGGASHDLGHWLRAEEECAWRGWPIVGIDRPLCLYLAHDQRCVVRQPGLYDSPAQLAAARERRSV